MARTFTSPSAHAIDRDEFFIDQETPIGAVNGVNKTYTLIYEPEDATAVQLFVNGQAVVYTDDYTVSGYAQTTVIAYPTGTTLRNSYRRKVT